MVEYQRIDLGPNRWMAAGGQAFLHVHAKKGHSVSVTLLPIGDVAVKHSVIFENPWRDLIGVLIGLFCFLPGYIIRMYEGHFSTFWGLLEVTLLALILAAVAVILYRRRGRPVLLYSRGTFERLARIDLSRADSRHPEFTEFVRYVESLSRRAHQQRWCAHDYSLHAWWTILLFVIAAIAVFTGLLPLIWKGFAIPYATAGALMLVGAAFLFSSERQLVGQRELRQARACLLRNEPDTAIELLRRFLERKPSHTYARELLIIAELMRCNMDVAEAVIVQGEEFDPNRLWRFMRALYYKHWESRHGEQ